MSAPDPRPLLATILLVDDDPFIRSIMKTFLTGKGFSVLAAASGAEALQLRQDHGRPIDLVITDMLMPGMNGPALVQQLLALQPQLRVIYISGYSEEPTPEQPEHVLALFLGKPFTMDDLLQAVQALVA